MGVLAFIFRRRRWGLCVGALSVILASSLCAEVPFETFVKRLGNTRLIVSNEPESLKGPGLILDEIIATSNVRVLYHHRNMGEASYQFQTMISNLSDEPSVIRVSRGEGGPTPDIVFSGHKAMVGYLTEWVSGGTTVEIPPHSTQCVVRHALKPGQTTSGIVSLEQVTTANLAVKIGVVDSALPGLSVFSDVSEPKAMFKKRVFEDSFRVVDRLFDVRDKIQLVAIGGAPYVIDTRRGYVMKGNYGVMYAVTIRMVNPLDDTRRVRMLFAPAKLESVDRGVWYRSGKIYETGLVVAKGNRIQTELMDEVVLNPGESRLVQWLILPQAGCFYPVDIIIKTVE